MANEAYIKKMLLITSKIGEDKSAGKTSKDGVWQDDEVGKEFKAFVELEALGINPLTGKKLEAKIAPIKKERKRAQQNIEEENEMKVIKQKTGKGEEKAMTDKEKIEAFLNKNPDKVVKAAPGVSGFGQALEIEDFDDLDTVDEEVITKKPAKKAVPKKKYNIVVDHGANVFDIFKKKVIELGRKEVMKVEHDTYFTRYGTPVDMSKYKSLKQLITLMTKEGVPAMCAEYREGFGLYVIRTDKPYRKSASITSYWSLRGLDVEGIRSIKQLITLMVESKASRLEVREGVCKILPDQYLNPRTKKFESCGLHGVGKGRDQIAYSATMNSKRESEITSTKKSAPKHK
jgi:hypothetical protein